MIRTASLLYICTLAVVVLAAGCGPAEQVKTYPIPKETRPPRAATALPEKAGEPTDRMLAVIVPEEGRALFYKAVGPIPIVDKHADAIVDFVAGVPPSKGAAVPPWKLPNEWTQVPGDSFRLATIRIPGDDKPLELAVSALPWIGGQEQILQNVNRWRGQMGLPPTDAAGLKNDTKERKVEDRTLTVVDLRGRSGGSGMMPPFAGGANRGGAARGALPADHPTIDQRQAPPAGVAPVAAADDPKFDVPPAWKPLPPSEFRRIGFELSDGAKIARVTVSDFSVTSAPLISDPLENVNRWRGEVVMPRITREDLEKTTERIEVDGRPATYVALIPDAPADDSAARATLGVMVTVGQRIWYFKLSGNRELVVARQDEFKTFLKSVRFTK